MASRSILVVDDDETTRIFLQELLDTSGFDVDTSGSLLDMWKRLSLRTYEALLLDLQLGEDLATDALPQIVRASPKSLVFMITEHGTIDSAVQAMSLGATDYIPKPVQPLALLNRLEKHLGNPPPPSLDAEVPMDAAGIIGESPAMKKCWSQLLKIKEVDSTVLIFGESGTGKELVARALHRLSIRQDQRFEALNCGAIPSELLEAELFGHKRGAFTDARTDKRGLFEVCSQGTLFLDEIAELPLKQQAKLLRVLQEREITPVGSSRSVKVNTRIIAATNKSLPELLRKGVFREDLFFRLSVLVVQLPPLRERLEDIPLLINHFVRYYEERFGKEIELPSRDLRVKLSSLHWPGNVRQLQNAIERGVVLSHNGKLNADDVLAGMEVPFSNAIPARGTDLAPLSKAKEEFESHYLQRLLKATRGNISEAARISGRYRADLYRLFARYDIDPSRYKKKGRTVYPST